MSKSVKRLSTATKLLNSADDKFYPNSDFAYIHDTIKDEIKKHLYMDNKQSCGSDITSDTTTPNISPRKSLIEMYFISVLSKLNLMSLNQEKCDLIKPTTLNNDEIVVPSCDTDFENLFYAKKNSKGEISATSCDNVMVSKPTCIGFQDQAQPLCRSSCEFKTFLQFFTPTAILRNTQFNNSIVTLRVSDNGTENARKTSIGTGNRFVGSTNLNFIADSVSIGDDNKFDNFYLGPGVEIASNNTIKSAIIYANSIISGRVNIGENVIIGKNVTIGAFTHISDNVIIEDNVVIDRFVNIHSNVRIKKNAQILEGTLLQSNVLIGENAKIYGHSRIRNNVIIGDGVTIKPRCVINNYVLMKNNSVVEMQSTIANNVIIDGECGVGNIIENYIDFRTVSKNNYRVNNGAKVYNNNRLLLNKPTVKILPEEKQDTNKENNRGIVQYENVTINRPRMVEVA